ncbi:MAG TPA: cation:proton antiporter [candidate division Zixibacteria bacterium]|nr:cation:proton antiporter [candidate division Zixibacteria bacterium]
MTEIAYLRDIVVILALSVAIVTLFHRLRLPPIAGLIAAGALVGPFGLGLVSDPHQVEMLSEIGVTLLLFGIGLEIPLDQLKRLWRLILMGGVAQVGLTTGVVYLIARAFDIRPQEALVLGCIIAISSTAIVLRGLEQRGEIDAPHGRFSMGLLIFQDLCVVPMILLIPLLGGTGSSGAMVTTLARALGIVAVVLIAGHYLVPRLMELIARVRQRQLFIMAVLLICIGTAWLSASAGVSLALGAFLAGLVVAGSQYRHQALADVIPFREVFISLFFVSVGMLIDLRSLTANLGSVALLLAAILILKFIVIFATGVMLRLPLRVSIMSGTALAQVGEFSFVLMGVAGAHQVMAENLSANLTAAIVLSMVITPLLLSAAPKLAAGVGKLGALTRLLEISPAEQADQTEQKREGHVIIGGYGLAGHHLAEALKQCRLPYIIVDLNPENIRRGLAAHEPIYFGDITSPDVLSHLDLKRASEFVIVINDPDATARAVRAARALSPDIHILARTRYMMDSGRMTAAGASEVVPAELEASLEVTSRVLKRHRLQADDIDRRIDCLRDTDHLQH